jgi:quercetin dioxygenase-like cupin family protein
MESRRWTEMFSKRSDTDYRIARPGVNFRTLAVGERTHLTEFRLSKGSVIPEHQHPHEQTGYLVSGRMKFTIDGEVFATTPGDGWTIPGGTTHGVEVLEDCVVIEVFSPAREDYIRPASSEEER